MPGITPIASGRISDLLIRQRLLSQMQFSQAEILQLQAQLTTGQRFSPPSADPTAALRGIELQRLLERKQQFQDNVTTGQSYLAATDSALSEASTLVADVRGTALSAIGATSTPAARQAAAQQIEQALNRLVGIGNQQFRGRYLFAGSKATQVPFELASGTVRYGGNDEQLLTFSDIDQLFASNASGEAVFGAVSDAVRGSADLNPSLRSSTRLADLRGGAGIQLGSISVTDGTYQSTIDLSSAKSIGDVARLLESNPPQGRTVRVTITGTGLNIALDAAGGGNLVIRDVGQGVTARQLGILSTGNIGTGPLVGGDVNPKVTLTTRLADLLGTRAAAALAPSGADNDLVFEAAGNGTAFNGVTVSFVDGGPGTAGSEIAVYDASNPLNKKLIVTIESGVSTANAVIAAVAAEGTFSARLDPHETGNDGMGTVLATASDPLATAVTAGGSGADFDRASGLQIVNGGQTHTIDFATDDTVEDLLNRLNSSSASLLAEINAAGSGIDVRSRLSGGDFSIGENGGQTAAQLGIRSLTRETLLADLNHGRGVWAQAGSEFQIRRQDGVVLNIDLAGAQTIGDVLDLINGHAANVPAATAVTARLSGFGNGIELVNDDPAATTTLAVLPASGSSAAQDLGLIPADQTVSNPASLSGTTATLTGRDVNPQETRGLFAALVRLKDAVERNDTNEIGRAIDMLDESGDNLNLARADVGLRQQSLDALSDRSKQDEVELKGALSQTVDADLTQVVSDLASRQTAFEAALRMTAQLTQLSLLNFL